MNWCFMIMKAPSLTLGVCDSAPTIVSNYVQPSPNKSRIKILFYLDLIACSLRQESE